jgi:hypothetical protein
VMLQEIRTYFTVKQLLRVTGPDGSYKVKRWNKSDLGSTKDVEIAKGSGTMLNPVQKAQMLAEMRQLAGLDPDDVQELMATGLSPYAAFQDNKGLQRIRRQIAEWEEGPPEGWQPPQAPVDEMGQPARGPMLDPNLGTPVIDPLTSQPVPGEPLPPPPDPLLAQIWAPVDSDLFPVVAKWRIRELTRAQQSSRYFTFPPEWRLGLDMEIKRIGAALAPPPMAPPPGGGGKAPPSGETPQLSESETAASNPIGA